MKHSCKKHGRHWCWKCLLFTASFPVEHALWEKAPIFRTITAWLGL